MNVAKWLLSVLLALPLMELVVFIAVSALIGFSWAFGLVLAGSVAGFLILRNAGGNHLERVRVALGNENFTALRTGGSADPILLAGILLLIPGFITDFLAFAAAGAATATCSRHRFKCLSGATRRRRCNRSRAGAVAQGARSVAAGPTPRPEPALRYRSKKVTAAQPNGAASGKLRAAQNDPVLVPMWTVC